ncbi:hypothetical protein SEA_OCTOBIEN14_143 [Gordonia phage Octobien14]|uniref:Uncharacterized protein n=1 Tax=Gordonia phage Octobien14 TaxID=2483673 RepID=A0A3G3M9X8_9CAUD|nr:hypothetical protein L3Y22_gp101 [Gordonia phage Octobien14]AYR03286.1 hypothetical protein SEA_OCTOBIEN14_143 [Gordonia phage Octobien14]
MSTPHPIGWGVLCCVQRLGLEGLACWGWGLALRGLRWTLAG